LAHALSSTLLLCFTLLIYGCREEILLRNLLRWTEECFKFVNREFSKIGKGESQTLSESNRIDKNYEHEAIVHQFAVFIASTTGRRDSSEFFPILLQFSLKQQSKNISRSYSTTIHLKNIFDLLSSKINKVFFLSEFLVAGMKVFCFLHLAAIIFIINDQTIYRQMFEHFIKNRRKLLGC
jgi:hypothetical protein